MAPEAEHDVLAHVPMDRRSFVRRAVLGAAFATPVIASFDMRSLTAFAADCIAPNQTTLAQDSKYKVEILGLGEPTGNSIELKVRVRHKASGRNAGSPHLPVRLRKIEPSPPPSHTPNLPKEFDLVGSGKKRHYELTIHTKGWMPGNYKLKYTIGDDRTRFFVFAAVGSC